MTLSPGGPLTSGDSQYRARLAWCDWIFQRSTNMKPHPLVSKRFEELSTRSQSIRDNRTLDFVAESGKQYFNIDTAEFKRWRTSVLSLLERVFGRDSVHLKQFEAQEVGDREYAFADAVAIFEAAREDYEGGYVFNLQSLVRAEAFEDTLEQAEALLAAGYKDPACVIAGVALESTLKELCARDSIPAAKLDKMNADLCKAGVYNNGMQKQVTAWADRRNSAAHGSWDAYTEADVEDMIRGVRRLIAEYA